MLSTAELIKKYESYTYEELFEIQSNLNTYSDNAKEAFLIVVEKKGGVDYLLKHQNENKIIAQEIQRIGLEVDQLNAPGVDISFIKNLITSSILAPEQLNDVIDTAYAESSREQKDVEIRPETIMGSIIGGGIASVVGGALWGLQLIYSKKIFIIFLIGLCLLCYGIIRLSTRQSKKNTVVLAASVISVVIALIIGTLVYQIVGYHG